MAVFDGFNEWSDTSVICIIKMRSGRTRPIIRSEECRRQQGDARSSDSSPLTSMSILDEPFSSSWTLSTSPPEQANQSGETIVIVGEAKKGEARCFEGRKRKGGQPEFAATGAFRKVQKN